MESKRDEALHVGLEVLHFIITIAVLRIEKWEKLAQEVQLRFRVAFFLLHAVLILLVELN